MEQATTREIADLFSSNVRGFQKSRIRNLNDCFRPDFYMADHQIHSTFDDQLPRLDMEPSAVSSDAHFFERPVTPPRVTIFSEQSARPTEESVDPGRDYSDKANEQLRMLQGPCKVTNFDRQFTRNYVPPKNERIEFIADLTRQQKAMMSKLRPRRSYSVAAPKLVETFSLQLSRDDAVNSYRKSDSFPDSKYHIDPIKSLQKIWPRVRSVTIKPIGMKDKTLDGGDFWSKPNRP
jgi:hypothetical protein